MSFYPKKENVTYDKHMIFSKRNKIAFEKTCKLMFPEGHIFVNSKQLEQATTGIER